MIEARENLVGTIIESEQVNGIINKGVTLIPPSFQEKETTPTQQTQEILPDENYNGLSKVTVNAIPNEYVIPSGSLNITTNGEYNVTNYTTANVQTSGADLNEYFNTTLTEDTTVSNNYNNKLVKKYPDLVVTDNVTSLVGCFENFTGPTLPKVICNSNVTSIQRMYSSCINIETIDVSGLNTSNVTNMEQAFSASTNLKTIVFGSNFSIQSVTRMNNMFNTCRGLTTIDLSVFSNPSNYVNVQNMFQNCTNLMHIDLRNFDFSKATNYNSMFGSASNYYVPSNCEIIVKDNEQKTWFSTNISRMTNVKTVAEYEGQ